MSVLDLIIVASCIHTHTHIHSPWYIQISFQFCINIKVQHSWTRWAQVKRQFLGHFIAYFGVFKLFKLEEFLPCLVYFICCAVLSESMKKVQNGIRGRDRLVELDGL